MNIIVDFALPLVAGICLLAAFMHLLIWLYRRRDWVHAFFALVSLAVLLYVLNQRSLYQATTVDAWNAAHWRTSVIVVLFYTVFPWFVASYSNIRACRIVLALNAPFVGLFFFGIWRTSGFFYSAVSNVGTRLLPWGEHVAVVVGARVSPAYYVLSLASIGVYAFALYLCRRQWRRGERVESQLLATSVVLMCAGLVVDTLRDSDLVPLYAGEYCFVAFVITMSMSLARRFRRHAEEQARLNARLQQEIVERQRTEDVIRQLVKVSSNQFGRPFFESMALELARILGADYACIGELHRTESDSIRTVAAVADGKLVPNFEYDLAHTPCENVVGKKACSYPSNVAEAFPEDTLLREWGAQGYVGVPLFGSEGGALGIMLALRRTSLVNAHFDQSILQIFSTRVGSELERMWTEEAFRAEKQFTETALNAQPDTFFVFKPSTGQAVRWNEAFNRVSGYSDQEIQSMKVPDSYYSEEDLKKASAAVEQVLKTGIGTVELDLITKDGRRIPTEYTASVIRDAKGDPEHIIAIGRDITLRRQMEAVQQENEKRLAAEQRARLQESKRSRRALLGMLEDQKRVQEELHTAQMHYTDFINASSDAVSYWKVPDGLSIDLPVQEQIDMVYQSVCMDANRASCESFGLQSKHELVGKRYIDLIKEKTFDQTFTDFINNNYGLHNYQVHEKMLYRGEYFGLETWYGTVEDGRLISLWTSSKDVTKLKQAEGALRVGAERFRSLMEHTAEGFYLLETPEPVPIDAPVEEQIRRIYCGAIVECNDAQARMYGYAKAEEVIGKTLVELHGGTDNPENIAFLRAWIEADYRISGMVSSELDRDGKAVWFSNNVVGIVEEGRLIRIWGTQTDVTEMKRAEEAVRESEARNRAILEAIPDLMFCLTRDGVHVAFHAASQGELFTPPAEILGRTVSDILPDTVAEIYLRHIAQAIDGGEVLVFEYHLDFPERDRRYYEARMVAHRPDEVLTIVRDITERKHAEESLRQKDYIIESASSAIATADLDGKMTYANPIFLEWWGFDHPDEFLGNPFTEYWIIEGRYNEIMTVLQDEGKWTNEIQARRKDGSLFDVQVSAALVCDREGTPISLMSSSVDITERKRVEKELHTTQMHYTGFINASSDVVGYWKVPDGLNTDLAIQEQIDLIYQSVCVDANRRAWETFGLKSKNEIIGKEYIKLIEERTLDKAFADFINNNYQLNNYHTYERPLYGDEYFGLDTWHGAVENGRLISIWTSSKDITKLKQAERELRESEESYRTLSEKNPHGIQVVDPTGIITYTNRAYQEMLGYTNEELIGKSIIELIEPVSKRSELRDYLALLVREQPEPTTFFQQNRRKDGEIIEQAVSWNYIKDRDTKVVGFMSIITDITERKRAEEETLRLRNYLKNIVNSMPSVLNGIDVEGKVTEWNSEAEKTTGIMVKQAQGRALTDLLPDFAFEMDKITKAIQERQVQKDEKVARRTDGQTCYSDVTVYPLMTNCVEGAVVRIDDVTDRVHLEEMMVQSEKMATVGGLAAGMAHEINNPLGVILQGTQTIERRLSPDLPANHEVAQHYQVNLEAIRGYLDDRQVLKMIHRIKEAGSRATGIVKNMLQFSRRSDATKESVMLHKLIDRTIDLAANDYDLRKKYDFRNVHLECDYDPRLQEIVCAATEIEQVLLNLLKNAAQAISEVEDLTEPCISIRTCQEDDMARIEVGDNGAGMSEEVRRRIFEPFFTTKEVGIGTGLGLAVSYMIIADKHRGTIAVDSSPGKGARFTIELPIRQEY